MNRRALLQAQRAGRNPRLGVSNITEPLERPSPIGGWNTRDSIAAMKPEDAVTLDNWLPQVGSVDVRSGTRLQATGVGSGAVETLAEYNALGNRKLLAAGGGGIYNATAVGGAASLLATGFASNRWQTVNFDAKMLWVAPGNTAQMYDGTVFAGSTITGPDITNLLGCHVHKSHIFVWERNTQDFWYSAVDTIGGAYTKFPLSRVTLKGGDLIAVGTWSTEVATTSGGPDDLCAFAFNSGEIIVYRGSNPADADNWAIAGRFFSGTPLGPRCIEKSGANLVIQTDRDYESMSQIFTDQRKAANQTKAVGAIHAAADSYRDNFGWQLLYYPGGPWLIGNVPVSSTQFDQHVLTIATGAWCRFKGWAAACFGVYNTFLYFGAATDGKVYQADYGNDDAGAAIAADAVTAWDQLKSARKKRIAAVRHIIGIESTGQAYEQGLGADFAAPLATAAATIAGGGAMWDVAMWDVAMWAGQTIDTGWRIGNIEGTHIARRVKVSAKIGVQWFRSDYMIEPSRGL